MDAPSSSGSSKPQPPPPLRNTQDIIVEGQEPTPLSPIDRVNTTFEVSIDAGFDENNKNNNSSSSSNQNNKASTSSQSEDTTTAPPSEPSIVQSKTLPLPASSSLLGEEDRPFAKPIRSFTNPNIDGATQQGQQQQQPQPQIIEQKVDAPEGSMEHPMIAELPATPLASPELSSHKSQNKQSPKPREAKPEDESVLYNLPITPDAEAFEVAKKNITGGYFEPVFPADTTEAAKTVAPVVEGGKS